MLQVFTLRSLLSRSIGSARQTVKGYSPSKPVPGITEILDKVFRGEHGKRLPIINNSSLVEDYAMIQLALTDIAQRPFPVLIRETVLSKIRQKSTRSWLPPDSGRHRAILQNSSSNSRDRSMAKQITFCRRKQHPHCWRLLHPAGLVSGSRSQQGILTTISVTAGRMKDLRAGS
jgi:hypothetical protein